MLYFRALIYTLEQVHWECQKAAWCEEGFWKSPNDPPLIQHCLLDLRAGYNLFRQPWGPFRSDPEKFESLYRTLAEDYSNRQLSNPSDSLNAFRGLLQRLEKEFNQEFYWALPVAFVEHALAWPSERSVLRNIAKQYQIDHDGQVIPPPFPS